MPTATAKFHRQNSRPIRRRLPVRRGTDLAFVVAPEGVEMDLEAGRLERARAEAVERPAPVADLPKIDSRYDGCRNRTIRAVVPGW